MENYQGFIQNILETRGRFACGDEYHERHHILPKCMGGTNDEDNLIDLFAREHFEAHRLLALENPDIRELTYAWSMMSYSKNGDYKITSEEYEEIKIALSRMFSGDGNPMYGSHRCGEENPMYGKHHSEETRKKISNKAKGRYIGENNPNYGKVYSEEDIIKQRKAHAKEMKCIVQLDTDGNFINKYESIRLAHRETGINRQCISFCCQDKYEKAGGFIWMYEYIYNQNINNITLYIEERKKKICQTRLVL